MRPIAMQVNYTLINTAVPFSPDDLEPVLDDYIPTTVTAQVGVSICCYTHAFSLPIRAGFKGGSNIYEQVCVQLPTSVDNVTLLAIAAERQPCSSRSRPTAANPPPPTAASHQTVHILFLANDRCLRDYDLAVEHC